MSVYVLTCLYRKPYGNNMLGDSTRSLASVYARREDAVEAGERFKREGAAKKMGGHLPAYSVTRAEVAPAGCFSGLAHDADGEIECAHNWHGRNYAVVDGDSHATQRRCVRCDAVGEN